MWTTPKEKWETELALTILEGDWKEACEGIFQNKCSPNIGKTACLEINTRLFTAPKIPSKYSRASDANCWRECEEHQANQAHIF